MIRNKTLLIAALALTGAWGTAQARDRADVQWSVAIPGPISVVIGNAGPRWLPPVPVPRIVYPAHPAPRYGYGDRDHDGIPNRHDRVYNPRWDRDGDGVPNRYDRHPNRPDQRGYDRRDDHRDDRWDDRRDDNRGDHRGNNGRGR